MSTFYGFFLSFILTVVFLPNTVLATPPDWVPAGNLQYNMQIVAYFQLEDDSYSINPNDLIAGFVNGECRGLATPLVEADGRIFLSIGSNNSSGETVDFKAYIAETGQIANLTESIPFIDQEAVGDYNDPFVFTIDFLYPPATYIINATAGEHGAIEPSGAVEVIHGNSQAFTFIPDENYEVLEVLIDGEGIGMFTDYTFENVIQAHTIEVIFSVVQSIETPSKNPIKCYPNPAKDILTVTANLTTNQAYRYQISDLKGQVVLKGTLSQSPMQLKLDKLKAGNYVFSILSEKERFESVVVNKVE